MTNPVRGFRRCYQDVVAGALVLHFLIRRGRWILQARSTFVGTVPEACQRVYDVILHASTDRPTQPTCQPTNQQTNQPTNQSTDRPTNQPTNQQTSQLTNQPTNRPTNQPTNQPTDQPTNQPTDQPTDQPTNQTTYLGPGRIGHS